MISVVCVSGTAVSCSFELVHGLQNMIIKGMYVCIYPCVVYKGSFSLVRAFAVLKHNVRDIQLTISGYCFNAFSILRTL